jgi:hypothetical protein
MSNPDDARELVEIAARGIYDAYAGPEPITSWKCISTRDHKMHRKLARAALTAIEASGWKIVPVEPSDAMVAAGANADIEDFCGMTCVANIYRAMIAASPKATGDALSQTDGAEEALSNG